MFKDSERGHSLKSRNNSILILDKASGKKDLFERVVEFLRLGVGSN